VSAEVYADLDAIDREVEDAWRAHGEARANVCVTPEWARAWLAVQGERARPRIAVSRDAGGEVRGVMPMARVRLGAASLLRFAGYDLGDVFHPACAEGDEEAVAAECVSALAAEAGFGGAILDFVPAGAGWPAAAARASGLAIGRPYRGNVLPWIDLSDGSWEDYLATRSRNLRSQVRRKTKAVVRDFDAVLRPADSATLAADFDALAELHERRWRGGSSVFGPGPRRFHAGFAAAALRRAWLRLGVLELRGEPAAALYGWHLGDRYFYYQAGFDPGFERESVGFVLLARTIRGRRRGGRLRVRPAARQRGLQVSVRRRRPNRADHRDLPPGEPDVGRAGGRRGVLARETADRVGQDREGPRAIPEAPALRATAQGPAPPGPGIPEAGSRSAHRLDHLVPNLRRR
jgi:CelD/BcsL family acetyltransferase involved in cellulose biosynthesis